MNSIYYQAQALREEIPATPTEMEIQALWFEQFYRPSLTTQDGQTIEIIQPGDWNHGSGPDFFQAAIRLPNGEIKTGAVELHLQAIDWQRHHHDVDPAYEETLLHVVWSKSAKTYFPATKNFRSVLQLYLSDQLIAPWEILRPHLAIPSSAPRPIARSGLCHVRLSQFPPGNILSILREAGLHRLQKKSERLQLHIQRAGFKQMLWEAIAEGLGYSQNKIPFRFVARRLPYSVLTKIKKEHRLAFLFGVAGFLPDRSLKKFSAAARKWIRPQWEAWWKARHLFSHAIFDRSYWKLTGIRPWNRPERRLAALGHLLPKITSLEIAIQEKNPKKFAALLSKISDPFWNKHASLSGETLAKEHRLIGEQRIHDLLINIFWPLVFHEDRSAAERGLAAMTAAENKNAEIARQRLISNLPSDPSIRNALVQQGLLQVYHDYCMHDQSGCKECRLTTIITQWKSI
jgi:hypothetical protein